jgi:cell wall-associated NlpC family hydrolase
LPSFALRCVLHLSVCCALVMVLLLPGGVASAEQRPGDRVADLAQEYAGSPYRWGGVSPAGFDCTGFVKWVFSNFGLELPHTEAGQLASGSRVSADELEPGDVVAFENTYRRGLSHVGIYLGEGRFVHAVDEFHGVKISQLWDAYWSSRLVGGSRLTV